MQGVCNPRLTLANPMTFTSRKLIGLLRQFFNHLDLRRTPRLPPSARSCSDRVNTVPVQDIARHRGVDKVLSSPGQPLDAATRSFFEPRFGHDFGQVRIHTDTKAAESARTVNALAYTSGSDVVFATGQYDPVTATGKRLLAHELTHVIQQESTGSLFPATQRGR